MSNTGNSLIMPGPVKREKKASTFTSISFLVSLPENEPNTNNSDHPIGHEGCCAHVPDPWGD
jgi:hypothetical protein